MSSTFYRYNVLSSKITKNWTAKPIKEKKTGIICTIWFDKLLSKLEKKTLPLPILPALPKNIAPTSKADKKEVIEKFLDLEN